jgi:hypothetical protein
MRFGQLKRREFSSLLGGAAAWPLAARAEQRDEQMRRVDSNRSWGDWGGPSATTCGLITAGLSWSVYFPSRQALMHSFLDTASLSGALLGSSAAPLR